MLELQTLGTVGIRSRDQGDSVAQPVQPKRLTLLIFLALAPRRRLRRRDQVVALLWPELDQEHARGALNQSVRYLRRCLGDEVLLTQGDDEVGINRDLLWCDATAFGIACEAGDFERALALYQGPFLSGYFADASAEFDQWVDEQRAGFRAQAAGGASRLCEAAEARGDAPAAVQWTRRGLLISPDDEAATARLIRLLDRSGDRVGALRTYEALRRRLKEEFGATPSAETEAIITHIRQH